MLSGQTRQRKNGPVEQAFYTDEGERYHAQDDERRPVGVRCWMRCGLLVHRTAWQPEGTVRGWGLEPCKKCYPEDQ